MPGHTRDYALRYKPWGARYCACFLSHYQADKVAPPPKEFKTTATDTFDIPELRVHILAFLPMHDLARAQRVSRSWYLTVTTTLKLRQHLYISSTGPPLKALRPGDEEDSADEHVVIPLYISDMSLNPRLWLCDDTTNAIMMDSGFSVVCINLRSQMSGDPHDPLRRVLLALDAPELDVVAGLTQSVTQPPCDILAIKAFAERKLGTEITCWLYNREGITLGDVASTMRKLRAQYADAATLDLLNNVTLEVMVVWPSELKAAVDKHWPETLLHPVSIDHDGEWDDSDYHQADRQE